MQLSAPHFPPSRTRAVTTAFCLLAVLLCFSGLTQAAAPPTGSTIQPPEFAIFTPDFGSSQTEQVAVKLQYIKQNETPSVVVSLNGRDISPHRFTTACQGFTCTVTGKLTLWDGLRVGENQLSATLANLLMTSATSTIGGNPQNNLNLPSMLLYAYSNMNYSPFQGTNGQPFKHVNYCTTHPEQ